MISNCNRFIGEGKLIHKNLRGKNGYKFTCAFGFLVLLFVVAIAFSGAVSAAGLANNTAQPKFHHDNNNTGQSQYKGPSTNTTKWKYTTADYIYYGSPVIGVDGTVYIASFDRYVYAIKGNGTLRWRYQTGNMISSTPAIGSDGTIYVESEDNYLYALNGNGTLKWKYQTGNGDSSPAIGDDGTIYVGSNDGNLYALNSDGSIKWKYQTGAGTSAPAIGNDGTIYIGSYYGYLYALTNTGTLKWKYMSAGGISSPAIGSDGTIYTGSYDNYLFALNSNGTLKWKYDMGSFLYSSPAIASDGTIYIGSGDGYLFAVNSDGTLKWKYLTGNSVYSSPAIGNDGTVYVGSCDRYLYAISSGGTLKWKYETGDAVYSSPAIGSDGTVYVGSLDGNLYAISDLKVSPSIDGGVYTGTKVVTLKTNMPGTIYWELYNSNYNSDWVLYTSPITINDSYTLLFYGVDSNGNSSPITSETYTINYPAPTVSSNTESGQYNRPKQVILTTNSDLNTATYYTCDGTNPQTSSTRKIYTSPFLITSTTLLKFSALDSSGSWSPIYTENILIDVTAPTVTANPTGGYYNTGKSVKLTTTDPESDTITYYTTDGTDPQTSGTRSIYTNAISINKSTTLRYIAQDTAGNWSPGYTQTYVIDTTTPTVTANPTGGLYNTTKNVTLTMSESGTIYYTINGTTPTSTSNIYKGPISITNTTTLKYMAMDLAGNQSPIYSQQYTIDKTAPKVSSTTPTNSKTNVSRTSSIIIKFTKNIKTSTNYSKITLKNLTTGKTVTVKLSITNNTLTIKPSSALSAKTSYQVTIPASAVKDYAGNNLVANYILKYQTGA